LIELDLHPGNILLRLPQSLDSLSLDQFYEKYGEPNPEPVVRLDNQPLPTGVPTHAIMPVWLGKENELITLSEARIFLTDFGESFLPSSTPRYYSNTPDLLIPPEVHFLPQEPLSFPADIWALACTIWTIIGQRPLFEGLNSSTDWMIKEHVDVHGKLPPEWWQKWDARQKWFNEEGTRNLGGVGRPWAERLEYSVYEPRRECGMEEIGEEEKAALFVMLKAMMAFRPGERLNAEEIMESEWMRRWALPELEKARETL
jgi:serine/threonine-protein kinase SRPK3